MLVNRFVVNLVFVLLVFFSFSCSNMSLLEYKNWVESDLKEVKKVDGLVFSVQFKPALYMAMLEMRGFENVSKLDSISKTFNDQVDFNFVVENVKSNDEPLRYEVDYSEYQKRVAYTLSGFERDFYIINGKQTVPCSFAHYEPTYNIGAKNVFVLSFGLKLDVNQDLQLVYEDKVFNKGVLKFFWSSSELKTAYGDYIN
jgi:hypothetical protein